MIAAVRLFECNKLDFDDLIHYAIRLLNESELANALFTTLLQIYHSR